MLAEDIAKLMNAIPVEEQTKRNEGMDRIEGGAFEGVMDKQTPFQVRLNYCTYQSNCIDFALQQIILGGLHCAVILLFYQHSQFRGGEGVNAGVGEVEWVVQKDRYKYDEMFDKLGPIDGKISGAAAKQESRTSERTFEIPNAISLLFLEEVLLDLIFMPKARVISKPNLMNHLLPTDISGKISNLEKGSAVGNGN